jgi:16S rRNA (cytosine967-C5)-methyltransferase
LERLTGLLNAVLRKIDPERARLPRGSSAEAIGVRASLPNWIVQELRQAYGIESYEAEAMSLRERAQTTIRPNSAGGSVAELQSALAAEGFHTEEGPRGMLILTGPGDPFNTQAFHAGRFVPQDPASLAVVDAMGDVAGKSVLDLCSGRGIKATELAARGARVTCVDNASSKLEESARLAERLGVRGQLTYLTGDPTRERLKLPHFDHVLVDAPCSGLGTLRRHPEIAWRRKRSDLQRMATLQAALLTAGADFLKEKGELTYAVCSFARIEGAVAVPSGLAPLGDDLTLRPTDGWDAFQLKRWQRKT